MPLHRRSARRVALGASVSLNALGLSLLALPATAQQLATPPQVAQDGASASPVFVLGDITLTVDDVAGYVAQGAQTTKSATPIAEAQQSISVVTADQIADQGAQNLGQALNYSAGVLGQPFGADPRFDSPTVRGFEARSAQYVNGLRQLRALGAPAIETYGIQQVEILKGPSSSLYGAGLPSGIINQVQKRAQATELTQIGAGFDSNDGSQMFFDVNRSPSEVLSWRLTGILRDSKEQVRQLTNERGYLGAALRYAPDDLTTVDIVASYSKDEPISPVGLPFELTRIADEDDLREFYAGETSFDASDRESAQAGVEISHQLDNGWTLSQGFRYETFDWDYTNHYSRGLSADGLSISRGGTDQLESSDGINLDTRLSNSITTGAATHDLLLGVDIRQYEAQTTTRFLYGQNLDWRNPVYGALPFERENYESISDITLRQVGVYVQDEIALGNWRGSVALRQDWTDQTGSNYAKLDTWQADVPAFSETVTQVDQTDQATTGRLGLSYVLPTGVMPYVSYATSFDPEIGTDLDGNSLKPTEGKQWELGVKYQPLAFDGLFTAALYDLRQENLTRNLGNGVRRQIGEVKSQGLELEATAALVQDWDLRASYAYNRTEQIGGDDDGNEMPNAPRHLASLWLDHDFGNGLSAGGGIRYVGSRKGDFPNNFDLGAVTLVDLGARYTAGRIETSVNLNNLTDEVYLANCGSFGCTYGEGRTLSAKVAYTW